MSRHPFLASGALVVVLALPHGPFKLKGDPYDFFLSTVRKERAEGRTLEAVQQN